MRKDQFYSCKGTITELPKKIGTDTTGGTIAMMQVKIDSYKGNLPVKFWRGLADEVLNPEIGLQIGDVLKIDGHLERRHYKKVNAGENVNIVKIFDDVCMTADRYKKELTATAVEFVEPGEEK